MSQTQRPNFGRRSILKYLSTIIVGIATLGLGFSFLGQHHPKSELLPANRTSRLPPNQRKVSELVGYSTGVIPQFNEMDWRLRIGGEVEKPLSMTWNEFLDLPKLIQKSDLHCVTGWSKLDNVWGGTLFRNVIALCGPRSDARFATFECEDGYSTSLPLKVLVDDDVMLVYELDGEELEPEHGRPLRLVVPKRYGYKSAKWIRAVKFTVEQELGYWEKLGYSNTADPWTEDRYSQYRP